MDAFKTMMTAAAMAAKPLEPKKDVPVFAVVYEWVLVRVPDDEPLKGITYVGQTVSSRFQDADATARDRWQSEKSQAAREDKELGLLAAISRFGYDAFDQHVLEWKHGDRIELQKWANEREMALIAERGGVLRDMEPTKPMKTASPSHLPAADAAPRSNATWSALMMNSTLRKP